MSFYNFLSSFPGWWLNQPIQKICSSNWIISPRFGMIIKNVWVATTQINFNRIFHYKPSILGKILWTNGWFGGEKHPYLSSFYTVFLIFCPPQDLWVERPTASLPEVRSPFASDDGGTQSWHISMHLNWWVIFSKLVGDFFQIGGWFFLNWWVIFFWGDTPLQHKPNHYWIWNMVR